MIKSAVLSVLVAAYLTATHGQIDEFIEDHNSIQTVNGLQCSRLEGSSAGCLACYHCDHDEVKNKRVQKLQFSYSNCTQDQLCCISTNRFTAKTSENDCGLHNPDGDPLVQRYSLRSVLEREYPWRAWVYSSGQQEPLCAATYIDISTRALLTTASCISGYQPSDLRVKFTKTQQNPYQVDKSIIHEGFSTSSGGNMNDIALLTLKEKPDKRVRTVCLESRPALAASSCIVVSDSENYINVMVPQPARCAKDNVKIENNVTCSYMAVGDYMPERGAGLYCLSEHFTPPAYSLQGIYQSYQRSGALAIYTSVSKYDRWIFRTTNHIKRYPRQ